MTALHAIGAALAALTCLVVYLMAERPAGWRANLHALARFGIIAGCLLSMARTLGGTPPPWEQTLLAWALAVLYASQIRLEALRQSGGAAG